MGGVSNLLQWLGRAAGPPRFRSGDVEIGTGVSFGRNVVFNCERVRIGDGVRFGSNITIDCTTFEVGDYATIYDSCFFPGPGKLRIGHNFWLGLGSIVDCQGGTTIGNNVGIGAQSQLWSHMKFGDVMAGCRFNTARPLVIEDDVWLVGHCLVSPVHIGMRSMAMLGSVVTRDMEADRVYAGVPARDITEKLGPQFRVTTPEERLTYLRRRLEEFSRQTGLGREVEESVVVVKTREEVREVGEDRTVFVVSERKYRKLGTPLETRLMLFLLPEVKFVPFEDPGARS